MTNDSERVILLILARLKVKCFVGQAEMKKRRIVGFKSPPEHLITIGDKMTIDHEINQLLVEIMTKEVLRRVKARLATLGVEVEKK